MTRNRPHYTRTDGPLYRWPHHANSRTVTVPAGVSAPVALIFSEMARMKMILDAVVEASGVQRATIKAWRRKTCRPGLENLEAVLNSLGWTLTPTPALEILPAEIAADMAALSTKMKRDMPETWAALLDWTARQHNQCITADQRLAEFARRREAAANDNRPQRRVAKAAATTI